MNKMGMKAAALIIGLPLFLWACEKDLGNRGAGKKVAINFTVGNEGYGADQQILKSAGAKPETVYMPLNDDYFMEVTLTPEPAEEVRATAAFETGQKIRFVAYNGALEVGSAIYTWNGSRFIPDDEPLGVESDNEVNYRFVAYSFFGDPLTEPDDEDVEEGISPAQDVVWGTKDQKIYDNVTSRTVPILMRHKFSRVQVKVDASSIADAQVTNVSGVVIAGGKKADLTVWTGAVAASAAAGADVTAAMTNWVSVDGGKARQSDCVVFYPLLTTITLATLNLEIDGVALPLTNKSVTFAQALDENTSYTVTVDVRTSRFAYSNIYWVQTGTYAGGTTGYLTFDTSNQNHQGYQGVYFKWGSLVGVSPAQTNGSNTFSSSTPVYIPSYYSWAATTSTWRSPTVSDYTDEAWIATESNTGAEDDPANIPYLDSRTAWASANMAAATYNTDEMYNNLRGDICQYLGKTQTALAGYRMPTSDELWHSNAWVVTGTFAADAYVGNVAANAAGTADLIKDAEFAFATHSAAGLIIPATGYRNTGNLIWVGANGGYWSSQHWITSRQFGAGYGFDKNGMGAFMYANLSHGFAVRCIKKLATE